MIVDDALGPPHSEKLHLKNIIKYASALRRFVRRSFAIVCIVGLNPALLFSEVMSVRHREGAGHGFLTTAC